MSGPEIAAAFGGGLIGVGVGCLLMALHWWQSESKQQGQKPTWRDRLANACAALCGVDNWLLEEVTQRIEPTVTLEARIASLTASLEDAHREVSRLCGEKHARDTVIHEAMEKLGSLHRQGNGDE